MDLNLKNKKTDKKMFAEIIINKKEKEKEKNNIKKQSLKYEKSY